MKKLISIGVALALLTMAVVPGVAAAYTPPVTYAKVPFAIIQSGLELMGDLLDILQTAGLGLPTWLDSSLTDPIAGWAGGPLSWTVDMLAWVLELGEEVWTLVDTTFSIGYPAIGQIMTIMSCKLMTCWSATNCSGYYFCPCVAANLTPCP